MDILRDSQLVIFSHSTTFITFSYKGFASFLFKFLQSSKRQKPEVALDFCVWPLCGADRVSPAAKKKKTRSLITATYSSFCWSDAYLKKKTFRGHCANWKLCYCFSCIPARLGPHLALPLQCFLAELYSVSLPPPPSPPYSIHSTDGNCNLHWYASLNRGKFHLKT